MGEKSSIGVQTEASGDVKRDEGTLWEVSGGGEVGQVEPVEQEQEKVTEEAMGQVRGTGREQGWRNTVCRYSKRERRVSTANRFEALQGEKKRLGALHRGLDREEDRQDSV